MIFLFQQQWFLVLGTVIFLFQLQWYFCFSYSDIWVLTTVIFEFWLQWYLSFEYSDIIVLYRKFPGYAKDHRTSGWGGYWSRYGWVPLYLSVWVSISVFTVTCVWMCVQGWGVTDYMEEITKKHCNCNLLLYQQNNIVIRLQILL